MMVSRYFRYAVLLTAGLFLLPDAVQADRSMSRQKVERELKHLRESLHEAHLELAKKADRIAELESALEAVSGKKSDFSAEREKGLVESVPEQMTASLAEKKAPCAKIQKEKSLDGGGAELPKAVEYTVLYEKASAANLEGREAALHFVEEQLEANEEARFSVRGYANDSAFEATDREIASNRARFLVDYFVICGIPESAFVEVSGSIADSEGQSGRLVVLKVAGK